MYIIGTTSLLICILFVGTYSDQRYRNKNIGFGCIKNKSFVHLPYVDVYYSYYRCNRTLNNFDQRGDSTIIFIGTPEVSASGYYEYNTFKDLPSFGASLLLQKYDLVFIDMPGIGYSWIHNDSYLYNIRQTLDSDISNITAQILNTNDEILKKDFYLYAESWGTKILPRVALNLLNNSSEEIQHNFQGIFLGSPFVSPLSQITTWPDHLLSQGFIDLNRHSELNKAVNKILGKSDKNDRKLVTRLYKKLEDFVYEETYGVNQCDLTTEVCLSDLEGRAYTSEDMKDLKTFIQCHDSDPYYYKNLQDYMNSQAPEGWDHKWNGQEREVIRELGSDLLVDYNSIVEAVLEPADLNVFVISGRNDLVSGPSATHYWLDKVNWTGNEDFKDAAFIPFKRSYSQSDFHPICMGTIGYFKRYSLLHAFNLFGVGHRIFRESYFIDSTLTKVFDLATKKEEKAEDFYGDYYESTSEKYLTDAAGKSTPTEVDEPDKPNASGRSNNNASLNDVIDNNTDPNPTDKPNDSEEIPRFAVIISPENIM